MDAQSTFSCTFTQSDLGPAAGLPSLPPWPAQRLLPQERRDLSVQVLARAQPVSELAREHGVSRKILYKQAHTAEDALTRAFEAESKPKVVLFYLPVTKAWLSQLVLALVLIGHSSYRGVVELLRDLFDWRISLVTAHNIVSSAVEPARAISRSYHLAPCASVPTMKSSRLAIRCSWGFAPHRPIATCSVGRITATLKPGACACWSWSIRASLPMPPSPTRTWACAGQALALPDVPCRGDVFHILHEVEELVGFLENRAYDALQLVV